MAFANKVAIITGASSGIGWEVALLLAKRGCRVGLIARRANRLQDLAAQIAAQGGKAAIAAADVGDRQQVENAITKLQTDLGPVDLLFANAGVGLPTELEPINIDQIETMFKVNTLGVVYAVSAVLPEMLRRGTGQIAAVSSQASYKGLPGESAYCASKAAVNVYMEGLRIQLRRRNIYVTTICPGFVKTPMTDVNVCPMPWLMNADKAAALIVRAIERKKKVFNFPWQLSLLMKVVRRLPDRMISRFVSPHTEDRPHPSE